MRRIKVGSLVSFDGLRDDPQGWALVSNSLDAVDWSNAELVRGDAVAHIEAMSGEFVVYGYTRLARSLLAAGLVDELDFAIHPLILAMNKPLRLVSAEPRSNGVVSIKVRP